MGTKKITGNVEVIGTVKASSVTDLNGNPIGGGGSGSGDVHLYEHTVTFGYSGSFGNGAIAAMVFMQTMNNSNIAFATLTEFKLYLAEKYKDAAALTENQASLFAVGYTINAEGNPDSPLSLVMLQYNNLPEDYTDVSLMVFDYSNNPTIIDDTANQNIMIFGDAVTQIL